MSKPQEAAAAPRTHTPGDCDACRVEWGLGVSPDERRELRLEHVTAVALRPDAGRTSARGCIELALAALGDDGPPILTERAVRRARDLLRIALYERGET